MMEELKTPKSLPKIITTAVGAVTMAYLLCNVAYMMLLSQQTMIDSTAIGALILVQS